MSDIILNKVNTPPSDINPGESALSVNNATGEAQLTDGDTGLTKPFKSVYGDNYQFSSANFLDTNTSNNFETYTGISYPTNLAVPGRKYEIEFNAMTRYSTGTRNHFSRIALDGSTLEEEIGIEHKDTGSDIRFPIGYKYVVDGADLNNAGGFIDYDYRAQQNGDTAYVYACTLTFKRVL